MNLKQLRAREWHLGSIVILRKYVTYTNGFHRVYNYKNHVILRQREFAGTLLAEQSYKISGNSSHDVFVLTLSSHGMLWVFKQDCDLLCE